MRNLFLKNPLVVIILGILAFVLFILLIRSIVIIDAGHVGVVTTLGKVNKTELYPGVQLKNPLATVRQVSTRTTDYTMSSSALEGNVVGNDSVEVLASDGAKVKIDITIFYKIKADKAAEIFQELGLDYESKIIRPQIRSIIRSEGASYKVNELYSTKREEFSNGISEKLTAGLESRDIIIEDVLLRDVVLSADLQRSIELKLAKQQEALRKDFEIDAARKEAERLKIEAQGRAEAQGIINATLTDRYLKYQYIEGLKEREGTIYVPTEGGIPLFKPVQ